MGLMWTAVICFTCNTALEKTQWSFIHNRALFSIDCVQGVISKKRNIFSCFTCQMSGANSNTTSLRQA